VVTEEVDEVGDDGHIIKGVYLAEPTAEDGLLSVVVDVAINLKKKTWGVGTGEP
jgi:hypothetical protein